MFHNYRKRVNIGIFPCSSAQLKVNSEVGEIAQLLRALVALPEALSLTLSIQMAAHKVSVTRVPS